MNLSFLDYYARGLNLSDPGDCDRFRLLVTYYLQGVPLPEIDKMVGMHSRTRRTGIHRLCETYIRSEKTQATDHNKQENQTQDAEHDRADRFRHRDHSQDQEHDVNDYSQDQQPDQKTDQTGTTNGFDCGKK